MDAPYEKKGLHSICANCQCWERWNYRRNSCKFATIPRTAASLEQAKLANSRELAAMLRSWLRKTDGKPENASHATWIMQSAVSEADH